MDHKLQKGMGLSAVMLAGVFLFHPIVAFVDILPDCIGYLLLCFGLTQLADLNGHIAEARRRFRVMLWVGVGQLVATYLIYGMIDGMMSERPSEMSVYEGPMLTLLFSFVLLVLQWYFLIPALRELFRGLDTLAQNHGADRLCAERRGKTPCERMEKTSAFFVITSSLLSFLPEASVLTSYEAHKGNPLFPFDWFEYVTLFRMAAGIVSTVIGLVWLVGFFRCIGMARKDSYFMEQIRETYRREILPQTGMLTVRRFSTAFLLFCIGTLFTVNLRINSYAVLPGIGFAAFVLAGVLLLGDRVAKKRGCVAACVGLMLVSLLQIAVNTLYLRAHLPEASLYETDAYWHYLAVRGLDGVEAVMTLILVVALLGVLYELVQTHTGVDYGTPGSEPLSYNATQKLHREFRNRAYIIFVIFFLSAVANVVDAIYRLEIGWIWLIALAFAVIGIWNLYSFTHDLAEHIRFFYRSDGVNKKL